MADLNITITDAPRSAITVASPGPQGPAGAGLSPIADDRLLGNVSGSTATPSALNATQVKELLGYVSSADLQAALPAPLSIVEGRTYVVNENQQVAFRFPIQVDGILRVDGILYEV